MTTHYAIAVSTGIGTRGEGLIVIVMRCDKANIGDRYNVHGYCDPVPETIDCPTCIAHLKSSDLSAFHVHTFVNGEAMQ